MIVKHKNLSNPQELKCRLNKLAALDIIMTEESESSLRVFHKISDPDGRVCIFKVESGSGDEMFIIFSEHGCIIKGFDHESFFTPFVRDDLRVWPSVYAKAPKRLLSLLDDPMYEKDVVTFCVWQETGDTEWQKGEIENPYDDDDDDDDDDGLDSLLDCLFASADDFSEWSRGYYEQEIPLEALKQVYRGEKITEKIVAEINPEREVSEALREIRTAALIP